MKGLGPSSSHAVQGYSNFPDGPCVWKIKNLEKGLLTGFFSYSNVASSFKFTTSNFYLATADEL